MDHIPVNHQWRSFYRVLAGLWGLYVLIFGIVAVTRAHGTGFNQKGLPSVLGLRANMAFAILSIVVGAVLVIGAVVGGNIGRWVNLLGGLVFIVAGLFGSLRRSIQTFESSGINLECCLKFSLCFRWLPHFQQQSAELFANRHERSRRNGMLAEFVFGVRGTPQHIDCFVLLSFSCCQPRRSRRYLQVEMAFEVVELWLFRRVA